MTTNEILTNLENLQKDYQDFYDEVWQDPEHYSIVAKSLKNAIDIIHKYQKILEIIDRWKVDTWTDGISYDCMVEISEVVENGDNNK